MSIKGSRTAKPLTLKTIKDRCEEVGECWEWAQCVFRKRPQVGEQGKSVSPRRRAYELHHDVQLTSDTAVMDVCRSLTCCNPAHLRAFPSSQVSTFMAKAGRMKNTASGAASKAAGKRKMSHLDEQKVAELRSLIAGGMTRVRAGEIFGISGGHAGRIASGVQWRPQAAGASIFSQVRR